MIVYEPVVHNFFSELHSNQPVYMVLEEENQGVFNTTLHGYSSAKNNLIITGKQPSTSY